MKNFDHILKEALNKTHTIVEQFLSYSRENANRRTLIIVPVVVICLLIPYLLFVRPPSVFPSGELVEIPEGLSLSEIAELHDRACTFIWSLRVGTHTHTCSRGHYGARNGSIVRYVPEAFR